MEQQHGLLIVDKPYGLSSAQCTNRLKRLGQKKIGHAGTLDPMATGVLLVLLGYATKISSYLMAGGKKIYRGTIQLGRTTDTWDNQGSIIAEKPWDQISAEEIKAQIAGWIGRSQQPVPPYSAAKYEGQPLYRLARAGKEISIKTKEINILDVEILHLDLPNISFRVVCSSGTYIRSLAHSLGTRLGCGAVLIELIREYSHPFGLNQAIPLEKLLAESEDFLLEHLLPVTAALPDWSVLTISDDKVADVKNGKALPRSLDHEEKNTILLAPDQTPLALLAPGESMGKPVWTILRGLWIN